MSTALRERADQATAPAQHLDVSVVIPCLNEADTIEIVVGEARAALAQSGLSGEILVADNGSTDTSRVRAQAAGAQVVYVPAPLAEMVNEHRPYLPVALLWLAAVLGVGTQMREVPAALSRPALSTACGLIFVSLCTLTWQRNRVFATPATYWRDVIAKAPSARAHLNYGVALMSENDVAGALPEFRRSLELAPSWYYTHINLGIAYQNSGLPDSARAYFDRAVSYDRYSGQALAWRAEFRLAQADYHGARADFLAALPVSLDRYRNVQGLASALAELGLADECAGQKAMLLDIDRATALADTAAIVCRRPAIARAARVASDTTVMALGLDLLYTRNDSQLSCGGSTRGRRGPRRADWARASLRTRATPQCRRHRPRKP